MKNNARRGMVMIFVVVFIALLALIPVGMQMIMVSNQKARQQLNSVAQADNVARAGLIDAIDWFRRQSTQPVRSSVNVALYPYADAAFKPLEASGDTSDETIGLVREYSISQTNGTWGRYEVKRQNVSSPSDSRAVHDITDRRVDGHSTGEGLAWYIESTGYVYYRKNSSLAYNQYPNKIVGRARVATEIRRLSITLPTNCAVIKTARTNTNVQAGGKIIGGTNNVGFGYYSGASGPSISGTGAQVTGNPATFDIDGGSSGSVDIQTILGVTTTELKLMADSTLNSINDLLSDYPSMAIIYIDGNTTFNTSHKLRGGGILYVNGNLTLDATSNTLFSGLIYASGNVTINGPALISGCLIVGGTTLTINGSGDVAEIDYDDPILSSVRQQVAQYRENKSTLYTFSIDNN